MRCSKHLVKHGGSVLPCQGSICFSAHSACHCHSPCAHALRHAASSWRGAQHSFCGTYLLPDLLLSPLQVAGYFSLLGWVMGQFHIRQI